MYNDYEVFLKLRKLYHMYPFCLFSPPLLRRSIVLQFGIRLFLFEHWPNHLYPAFTVVAMMSTNLRAYGHRMFSECLLVSGIFDYFEIVGRHGNRRQTSYIWYGRQWSSRYIWWYIWNGIRCDRISYNWNKQTIEMILSSQKWCKCVFTRWTCCSSNIHWRRHRCWCHGSRNDNYWSSLLIRIWIGQWWCCRSAHYVFCFAYGGLLTKRPERINKSYLDKSVCERETTWFVCN